jgi:hypothetical protein
MLKGVSSHCIRFTCGVEMAVAAYWGGGEARGEGSDMNDVGDVDEGAGLAFSFAVVIEYVVRCVRGRQGKGMEEAGAMLMSFCRC